MAEPSVFISYRRSDTGGHAGRLYDALIRRLGRDRVFMDMGKLRPGDDWATVLSTEVNRADVVLALIGPDWLTVSDAAGKPRLADEADPVRVELEMGLAAGKAIFPVLLGGAQMPAAETVPASISPVMPRQAVRIENDAYADGVRTLVAAIRNLPATSTPSAARPTRSRTPGESVTLTFLFSDVVGSTELLQRLGEERGRALFEKHHAHLSKAILDNGGTELEWLGDGVLASFSSSAQAIKCALEMQRAARKPVSGQAIGLRVGVHTGEAMRREGGYFGNAVVIARRLCDAAQSGQVLTSGLVASMLSGRSVKFRPQGSFELKGLSSPVDVFAVEAASYEPAETTQSAPTTVAHVTAEARPASRRRPLVVVLAAVAALIVSALGVYLVLGANQPTGRPPVIANGSRLVTFSAGTDCASRSCYIRLLEAVTDPDGDPVHLVKVGPSDGGAVVNVASEGGYQVAYWSAPSSFTGTTDRFEFIVADNHYNQVTGTVNVIDIPAN
jgi:class 3 adenylate cyclase